MYKGKLDKQSPEKKKFPQNNPTPSPRSRGGSQQDRSKSGRKDVKVNRSRVTMVEVEDSVMKMNIDLDQ